MAQQQVDQQSFVPDTQASQDGPSQAGVVALQDDQDRLEAQVIELFSKAARKNVVSGRVGVYQRFVSDVQRSGTERDKNSAGAHTGWCGGGSRDGQHGRLQGAGM